MQVYLFYPEGCDMTSYEKFKAEFWPCITSFNSLQHLEQIVKELNIENVYWTEAGFNDGKLIPGVRNMIHSVFNISDPHGDRYAYVSRWLSEQNGGAPYVPHIVHLPEVEGNYREMLNIPPDATVFGRLGGADQFDIPYLPQAIAKALNMAPDIYFLLMNTKYLGFEHPRVIYLEGTTDLEVKRAFMNSIDAFVLGRTDGESFGLAVCEALFCNKPVITNLECRDRHHIQVLGSKGFYYTSENELATILALFEAPGHQYFKLVEEFSPEAVMKKFEEVFLN
jgi:glycosyltransferase involved in cell wall biosynthesis